MPGNFFDSNIAVTDQAKADRAENLIRKGGAISVQVLNESASVLRQKRQMSWGDVSAFLLEIRFGLNVYPVTTETHESGLRLAERYGFSIYDSFIVAAALQADCDTLWSEDMRWPSGRSAVAYR